MSIFGLLKKKPKGNPGEAPKPSAAEELEAARNAFFETEDIEEAIPLLDRIGSLGDPDAYAMLARYYHTGEYVEKDFRKAFAYAMKAMDGGSGDGALCVAAMLNNGDGTEQDRFRALEAVHLAMDDGIEGAEDAWHGILGNIALSDPDPKNWSKRLSAEDYKKLLELESNRAIEAGEYQTALPLLIRRAQGGDPEAAYQAGRIYFEGLGTDVNLDEAIRWSEAAAEQGYRKAIIYVMVGYFGRRTVPGNPDAEGDLKHSVEWAQRLLQCADLTEDETESANYVLHRYRMEEK